MRSDAKVLALRAREPRRNEVVRVLNHVLDLVVTDRTVNRDRVPMALVEVIARADRRVLRAKSFCQVRVALEADLEWEPVEVRERASCSSP